MEKENGKDGKGRENNVWVLNGDGNGRKMRVGIFRGKKGKRKMERKMERKNWIENEMKINGDGYGKNKLVEEKIGIGVEFT